jgi:hypothetical protein
MAVHTVKKVKEIKRRNIIGFLHSLATFSRAAESDGNIQALGRSEVVFVISYLTKITAWHFDDLRGDVKLPV